VERRGAACTQQEEGKKKKKRILLFYYFIIFSSFRLNPADVRGVKPWEPPHLLPPTSYLYYYIRLLMSLISLFLFALTFGKLPNYFTCEKEDF
jgi:hypothetical protein